MPKSSAPFTESLIEKGVLHATPFELLDVGASGGIDSYWSAFGPDLRAVGFDPLVGEIEWLNSSNTHPGVRYVAAFVGSSRADLPAPQDREGLDHEEDRSTPFYRSSSARAQKLLGLNRGFHQYDTTGQGALASQTITLDSYLDLHGPSDPDFIKIDTDGFDFMVLTGAEHILRERTVAGLRVECQFHGPADSNTNVFANIDSFLRSFGFMLFALTPYQYSRAALPMPFYYQAACQTVDGPVLWAEALYARDAGDPGFERKSNLALASSKILKLACIFELHELPDCAAELLLKYRDTLSREIDVDRSLDLLMPFGRGSYRDWIAKFERDPRSLFPNLPSVRTRDQLRINELETLTGDLESRLENQVEQTRDFEHRFHQEEIGRQFLEGELQRLQASLSWRITGPLRRAAAPLFQKWGKL